MTSRPIIAGNWKMNGLGAALDEARRLASALEIDAPRARVALCPPATLISRMAALLVGLPVEIGGQDCRPEISGAFTGDVSAEMLADAGANLIILGHSERRAYNHDSDELIAAKVDAALRAGLEPIICVGETLEQRRAGGAVATVARQLTAVLRPSLRHAPFAVAYEPVWAIGSGLTPTLEEIDEIHSAVRAILVSVLGPTGARPPILYGGSLKPDNAAAILGRPEVGGGLVGGASLKATEFLAIIAAA